MKIYGFYHICTINNWKEIVQEQLCKIVKSGLYDETEKIFVSIIGNECNWIPSLDGNILNKCVIIYTSQDTSCYERKILEYMREFSYQCEENDKYYYLHSKGIKWYDNIYVYINVQDWRRYMEYFIIEKYKSCVQDLAEYDVCGVNFSENPKRHFSGNFWWARSGYIKKLPTKINDDYLDPEMWLCSSNPKHKNYFSSGINHYWGNFPLSKYAK